MGNMQGMGSKYHMFDILNKIYDECKGKDLICGFYNFIQPVYMVIDPELAKTVLVKDFNSFVNRGQFVNEEEEPLTGMGVEILIKKFHFVELRILYFLQ